MQAIDTRKSNSLTRRLLSGATRKVIARSTAALIGTFAFANASNAGFTATGPPHEQEDSIPQIISHIYGGSFSLSSDGEDYSNGSFTAVRVSDTLPSSSTSDNPGPNATDQLWQASTVVATAEAVFTQAPAHSFGYVAGSSGGTYQSLFPINGYGYGTSGTGSFTPGTSPFRFAGDMPLALITTLPSDNKYGGDHIATFEIDGLNDDVKTWLLFFDDYGGDNGVDPDGDFNDLVIQLQTTPLAGTNSVPEPGSLMVIGGAGLFLLKRTRRASLAKA